MVDANGAGEGLVQSLQNIPEDLRPAYFDQLAAAAGQVSSGQQAAVIFALLIITFLHVVIGELVPKGLALGHPERTALFVSAPVRAFFTVFGPRQRPDLAIHKFTRLISRGEPIPFFGDGSTSRDYTFVEDIVNGIMLSLEKCDRYRIYNLGGSDPVTLKQLIEELERAIGKPAIIDRRPAQPGDVERTYADLTRSTAELGYKPQTSLAEGLRRFVEWFREYGHLYTLPDEAKEKGTVA